MLMKDILQIEKRLQNFQSVYLWSELLGRKAIEVEVTLQVQAGGDFMRFLSKLNCWVRITFGFDEVKAEL